MSIQKTKKNDGRGNENMAFTGSTRVSLKKKKDKGNLKSRDIAIEKYNKDVLLPLESLDVFFGSYIT